MLHNDGWAMERRLLILCCGKVIYSGLVLSEIELSATEIDGIGVWAP